MNSEFRNIVARIELAAGKELSDVVKNLREVQKEVEGSGEHKKLQESLKKAEKAIKDAAK